MTEKLERYNRKRNFEKTGEPHGSGAGENRGGNGRLKYVVQHHIARRDHYDFRLEWDGALLSWAVPKGPSYNPTDKRLAVRVEDHPLDYRNFEGTIPKGQYGGGTVMLWDEGFWESRSDIGVGLSEGSLKFELYGQRLKGKWALVRLKDKESAQENWLLLKEKDEYAYLTEISGFDTSVRTGRTMEEIEKIENKGSKTVKNPIKTAKAQLAKLVDKAPEDGEWLYELKYDGYRILAFVESDKVRLVTRNGNELTGRFGDVADSLALLAGNRAMILDGEMVITDAEGRTDFQALQNYMKNPTKQNLTYIIFDLLALDGEDLRKRRLIDRKELLENLMKGAPKNLYYSKSVKGNGEESFDAACKYGLEGIIGKRADSAYSGMRNGDWIKLKCRNEQEFVIGGYTLSDKKTEGGGVSSLLLGFYREETLIYAGRSGTGFTERTRKELEKKFGSLKIGKCPFSEEPKPNKNEAIIWLEPEMVAEIKFAEWTDENLLRQASFKGLRMDKNPKEVKMEKAVKNTDESKNKTPTRKTRKPAKNSDGSIQIGEIMVTSPDKVIFVNPLVKKADVVGYYEKVAERMMPYVGDRILSIVRCPKGVSSSCFFKKHPGSVGEGVVTVPVKTSGGAEDDYFYLDSVSGLLWEAQMGTLEFHIWGSRIKTIEKPDMMVFDMDPDVGMSLGDVRRGVKDLKSLLNELKLVSFLKTSGGKGYHVVVPFEPSVEWDVFHDFAKSIAVVMENKWPERYTSNIRKEKRKGKIFIDWIRNARGATSVAPYSLRARDGAYVSMPIEWKELDKIAPNGVDMAGALKRIKSADPWKDFYKTSQSLKL